MTHAPPQQFDVHLFPIVRIKICAITASSPEAAIEIAQRRMPLEELEAALRRLDPVNIEYAEEFSHYLVDYAGDDNFDRSRFFHSSAEPCLEPLRRLVDWFEQGREEARLPSLIDDVRLILSSGV